MLQENAVLQWRMFERAQSTNGGATDLRERAQEAEAKAEPLRKLLLGEPAR